MEFVGVTLPAASLLLTYLLALGRQKREPLRLSMPATHPAAKDLYTLQFFSAIAADGFEPVWNQEIHVAREVRYRTAQGFIEKPRPMMPFRRVCEASIYQDDTTFQADCGRLLNSMIDVFQRAARATSQEWLGHARFFLANREIIHNIFSHSGDVGYGSIRVTTDWIDVCYTDVGVGMRASLEKYRDRTGISLRDWSDDAAILAAFQYGVTGTLEGRGTGLPDTLAFAESAGGFIQCRSGGSSVTFGIKNRPPTIWRNLRGLPGTQIALRLPVRQG